MKMWSKIFQLLNLLILFSTWVKSETDPRVDNNPLFRTSNHPDFVGFSYSQASLTSTSERFIHFLKENVNVNANFLPRFGSFRVNRPGIYYFTFSFLSKDDKTAIVALRLNGKTLASGISEANGHNPVSQSSLASLNAGDVVQLEILQGQVYETNQREFAYTTFSGWMLSETTNFIFRQNRRNDDCCRQCCSSNDPVPPYYPPPTQRPPFYTSRPDSSYSYNNPPVYSPTTTPPHIIYTTSKYDAGFREECCDSVLVSGSGSRALEIQNEKFGVYRLVKIDNNDGRAVFKHCDQNIYIYYYRSSRRWSGWIIGPNVGVGKGGLILESRSICVEKHASSSFNTVWKFYDNTNFVEDHTISVSCFVGSIPKNERKNSEDINDADQVHYHHHEHVHHNGKSVPRALDPPGPAYNIHSNPEFVEATFVFPNRNDTQPLHHHIKYPEVNVTSSIEVIEARNNGNVINPRTDDKANGHNVNYV